MESRQIIEEIREITKRTCNREWCNRNAFDKGICKYNILDIPKLERHCRKDKICMNMAFEKINEIIRSSR